MARISDNEELDSVLERIDHLLTAPPGTPDHEELVDLVDALHAYLLAKYAAFHSS